MAEPDSSKTYKFDVVGIHMPSLLLKLLKILNCCLFQDLQKSSKDFDFLSGKYSMKLVIGDSVILNPFIWHMVR